MRKNEFCSNAAFGCIFSVKYLLQLEYALGLLVAKLKVVDDGSDGWSPFTSGGDNSCDGGGFGSGFGAGLLLYW